MTHIFRVPYDSGQRGVRMGAGPDVLGPVLEAALGATGETIEAPDGFRTEATTAFALARALAERVQAVRAGGDQPLVLAGNCFSSVGTVSGVQDTDDDLGVVWFDAHGDVETPETTTSGFLDGMALAAVMGRCWPALTRTVPNFRAIRGDRVVLVAARDVSAGERALIESTGITWVREPSAMSPAIDGIVARGAKRVYVHMDLDVHDPSEGRVNSYPVPGGPSAVEVREFVRMIRRRVPIAAAAITAYDPSVDPDGRIVHVARELAPLLGSDSGV